MHSVECNDCLFQNSCVCYVQFYLMLNPLEGVEIAADLPTIDPLWPENQAFDMICYLSTSNKFKEM